MNNANWFELYKNIRTADLVAEGDIVSALEMVQVLDQALEEEGEDAVLHNFLVEGPVLIWGEEEALDLLGTHGRRDAMLAFVRHIIITAINEGVDHPFINRAREYNSLVDKINATVVASNEGMLYTRRAEKHTAYFIDKMRDNARAEVAVPDIELFEEMANIDASVFRQRNLENLSQLPDGLWDTKASDEEISEALEELIRMNEMMDAEMAVYLYVAIRDVNDVMVKNGQYVD